MTNSTRKQKIETLQKVFQTGSLQHLEGSDEMTVEAVVVLRGGWYQIVPIKPNFKVPDKEMSQKDYQEFISSIPLFPDL